MMPISLKKKKLLEDTIMLIRSSAVWISYTGKQGIILTEANSGSYQETAQTRNKVSLSSDKQVRFV